VDDQNPYQAPQTEPSSVPRFFAEHWWDMPFVALVFSVVAAVIFVVLLLVLRGIVLWLG
jgi:hypothetical protein